jgi:hypothetical protein
VAQLPLWLQQAKPQLFFLFVPSSETWKCSLNQISFVQNQTANIIPSLKSDLSFSSIVELQGLFLNCIVILRPFNHRKRLERRR